MSALKKRMTGLLQRKDSGSTPESVLAGVEQGNLPLSKLIATFCASGKVSDDTPALVRIPEISLASPSNAQDAAKSIRKIMSNPASVRDYELYNAVMLVGILARHIEGHLFTACIDDRLVGTMKLVLRQPRPDIILSKVLLKDTIDEIALSIDGKMKYDGNRSLEEEAVARGVRWKPDPGIQRMLDLRNDPKNWGWYFEQQNQLQRNQQHAAQRAQRAQQQNQQQAFASAPLPRSLPHMLELSERLREANTSANILEQSIHSHGGDLHGLFGDEIFREFSVRCDSAKMSLQRYIELINSGDTSQHYDDETIAEIVSTRSRVGTVLSMRETKEKAHNSYRTSNRSTPRPTSFAPPPGQPSRATNGASGVLAPAQPIRTPAANAAARLEDPFDDSNELKRPAGLTQRLPGASSSRPSLAVNTGSYDRNASVPAQSNGEEQPSAPPRKYVF